MFILLLSVTTVHVTYPLFCTKRYSKCIYVEQIDEPLVAKQPVL